MPLVNCASCDGLRPYRVEPDRLFACTGCGKRLDVSDIDLDGQEEWMVSADGLLGYVDVDGLSESFARVHRGADLVHRGLALSRGEADAVGLAVSAILSSLEVPETTLADVASACYGLSVAELGTQYGWAQAVELSCPECESDAVEVKA
ncbi:hypothetical protein [Streptomyces xanthophaeus]|uniref:hypothetical protein n=1 Tax=Streptomyces xanthophaeus TaxID=67385 RepID=UPI00365C00B8